MRKVYLKVSCSKSNRGKGGFSLVNKKAGGGYGE